MAFPKELMEASKKFGEARKRFLVWGCISEAEWEEARQEWREVINKFWPVAAVY